MKKEKVDPARVSIPFSPEKRKLVLAFLSLFGALPLVQFFKIATVRSSFYFFIASLRIGDIPPDSLNFRDKEMISALDNKMFKEKKILKQQTIFSKNKISWIYIFVDRQSRWEWENAILKYKMFSVRKISKHFKYFQTEGFLTKGSFNLKKGRNYTSSGIHCIGDAYAKNS